MQHLRVLVSRHRKGLMFALSTALSIAGLFFVFRGVDLDGVQAALQLVDYRFFLLSLLIAIASQFIPPLRWRVLLNYHASYLSSCSATFIGNLISALVPWRMGEVVRASLIHKGQSVPLGLSVSTIVAGQVMDVLGLLALAALLLLLTPLPPELLQAIVVLAALTAGGLLLGFLLLRLGPARSVRALDRWFQPLTQALHELQSPTRLIYAAALSLIFWLVTALAGSVLLMSLVGEQLLALGVMLAFTAGIGRLLPALPGGIGTVDAAVLLGLAALGVHSDMALTLVLLLRLRYLLMTVVVGGIGFLIVGYQQFIRPEQFVAPG